MPVFVYRAVTDKGKIGRNKVDDISRKSLIKKLRRNKLKELWRLLLQFLFYFLVLKVCGIMLKMLHVSGGILWIIWRLQKEK